MNSARPRSTKGYERESRNPGEYERTLGGTDLDPGDKLSTVLTLLYYLHARPPVAVPFGRGRQGLNAWRQLASYADNGVTLGGNVSYG
jgi:hypothetical protein